MVTVRTPVPGFFGAVGSVEFVDGVADVPDPSPELAYMRAAGYLIEGEAGDPESPAKPGPTPEPEPEPTVPPAESTGDQPVKPRQADPVADWRAYAVATGMSTDEAEAQSKNQLIAHFNGSA